MTPEHGQDAQAPDMAANLTLEELADIGGGLVGEEEPPPALRRLGQLCDRADADT